MVSKFLGLDELMEKIVRRMGNVEKAIIVGDYAQGVDSGTIDLVLVGRDLDLEYLDFIVNKTFEKINRKIRVRVVEESPEHIAGILVYGK